MSVSPLISASLTGASLVLALDSMLRRCEVWIRKMISGFMRYPKYIDYLLPYAPHLYGNKQPGQNNERKYIGVVLRINDLDYFAPLSSAKKKHKYIEEGLDFIRVKNYAVINLNNMIPVPMSVCKQVDFSK